MPSAVWAIVVAAGEGRRFGGAKQFELLRGRSVLERSVGAARAVAERVVVVLPEQFVADRAHHGGADAAVAGGSERASSVRAGLTLVPDEIETIVVHDAARPLATGDLFRAVVQALDSRCDGVVPGIPLADTIKRIEGDVVLETLDRRSLVAVQTPQAFSAAVLRKAHAARLDATDDAALLEAIGATVTVVPGEPWNIKLTDAADLATAERYLDLLLDVR